MKYGRTLRDDNEWFTDYATIMADDTFLKNFRHHSTLKHVISLLTYHNIYTTRNLFVLFTLTC